MLQVFVRLFQFCDLVHVFKGQCTSFFGADFACFTGTERNSSRLPDQVRSRGCLGDERE